MRVSLAAHRIYEKLTEAGPSVPVMDEYYRTRYYSFHLGHLASKLKNCAYHVLWSVAGLPKPIEHITLIDHGAGLGFIGLLAKEAGVGRVIYNDIDPKFLEAAVSIAAVARAESDLYVLGDVNALMAQLKKEKISADVLVSYDVLEHIYDLDGFFVRLCAPELGLQAIMASSGANMFSPQYLKSVFPVQAEREAQNYKKRVARIRECAPGLSEKEIQLLGKKTRLLLYREVDDVIHQYLEKKVVLVPKKTGANSHDLFRSNTVDPETGWWAEHLVNPYYLVRLLRRQGFRAKIRAGFYGGRGAFLNPLIRTIRAPLALPIAAYYTLYAIRQPYQ